MGGRKVTVRAALYGGVALALATSLFPLLWIVLTSFKANLDIIKSPPLVFFTPTLEHYRAIFLSGSEIPFHRYFLNSTVVSLASTGVSVAIACLAAYGIVRLRPRGAGQLNLFILGVRMLPPVVLVVPLYILYRRLGLIDTLPGLILPYTALNIPLATWMLESFFLDLPRELEDAALVDGCNTYSAFFRVILPLSAPGLAATAVLSFVLAWNDLTLALPLTTFNASTLPVLASQVRVEEGVLWGQLGAITTVLLTPVVAFTLLAQRHIVSGMTAGAVKQ